MIQERNNKLWFREELFNDVAQEMEVSEIIVETKTEFQNLKILKTPRYGKILVLDEIIQTTQEDEFVYHEAMSHSPLFLHPQPEKILIVGGGDGGVLREIIKHQKVKKVDLVEIDKEVIDICQQYLPELSSGAFADPRVNLIIADGAEFVKDKKNAYDVIIIDSPDPVGPAEVLFKTDFYKNIFQCLCGGGIVIRQTGSSVLQPAECPASFRQMKEIFDEVEVVLIPTASYIGGDFTLTAATKKASFADYKKNVAESFQLSNIKTRWYAPEIYFARTILPAEFKALLEKEKYGEELIIDLYGCDYTILSSTEKVKEWAEKTCGVIKMKPYGQAIAPNFGHAKSKTAGLSVIQLIESSSISAHYSPHWLLTCANIFTCTALDVEEAVKFTMKFFRAKKAVYLTIPRGSFDKTKRLEDIKIFEKTAEEL